MVYPYDVKFNGVWYKTGENVPNKNKEIEKVEVPKEQPPKKNSKLK